MSETKTFAEKLLVDYFGWPELPSQWRKVIDHPMAWEIIIATMLNGELPAKNTPGYDVLIGDDKLEVKVARLSQRTSTRVNKSGQPGVATSDWSVGNLDGKSDTIIVCLDSTGTELKHLILLTKEDREADEKIGNKVSIPNLAGLKNKTKAAARWRAREITLEQLIDIYV